MAQRLARDEWHDIEQQVVFRASAENRKDVWVLQVGGQLDLLLEPRGADFARELRRKELDHYRAVERGLGGQEQAAHSTAAQLPLYPVGVTDRTLQASQKVAHGRLRYGPALARARNLWSQCVTALCDGACREDLRVARV